MEKYKRWQFLVIFAVVFLTVYNILPTIFYYANPLKTPVTLKGAEKVSLQITERVNDLEGFTISWLKAQAKNVGVKPVSVTLDQENPRVARLQFKKAEDANRFRQYLPLSGALIPFVPAQLSLDSHPEHASTEVLVQRKIGIHLNPQDRKELFQYISKTDSSGQISDLYRELINDRAAALAESLGGQSAASKLIESAPTSDIPAQQKDAFIRLSRKIVEVEHTFGQSSPLAKRFFASISGSDSQLIDRFTSQLNSVDKELQEELSTLKQQRTTLQKEGNFLDSLSQQRLEILLNQQEALKGAISVVQKNRSDFISKIEPLTKQTILEQLQATAVNKQSQQKISIGNRNPLVDSIAIDWGKGQLEIILHPDVATIRSQITQNEQSAIQLERLNQLLYSEIAAASQKADEEILPSSGGFLVDLNTLTNSSSLLAFDLKTLAEKEIKNIAHLLDQNWHPILVDFSRENFPIGNKSSTWGLQFLAPLTLKKEISGFRNNSLYVIVRGFETINEKYKSLKGTDEYNQFNNDWAALKNFMQEHGFIGYFASKSELPSQFSKDYIFELNDFSAYILAATRENFTVKGSKRFATLEFTDFEQRLLTQNKIDDQIHEDLVRWRDTYQKVRAKMDPQGKYEVPPPTSNVLLSNLALSFKKYFRGDQHKIIKWGLDLSGGKTVRIGLKDQNNQPITDPNDLNAALNELYQRVNRLGLSEVSLRTEGTTIVADFPGSQALSASELIKASAMYFHIVNEKFTPNNRMLAEAVNTFLEDVWNEAVITNRTDPENINKIAWAQLGGSIENPLEFHPLTSHAQLLVENGLRLAGPKESQKLSAFNDDLSMVTILRGKDFTSWENQTHPLLIVFHNYALDGTSLTDVQTGYDPAKGNTLYFNVKGSSVDRRGVKSNPRADLHQWTSHFAEDQISGTEKAAYSKDRGWRMAVILNGTVVSDPVLNSTLRDSASITGHFSQTEINKLAADLKAGSLSFTPDILSEENVSPDLGKEQRTQGIIGGIIGLLLVFAIMGFYYRFAGIVAIVAVTFNLLIIWAVLQNLGAALTLSGIAGIILAVGMSVDANVLVFERFREEFALTKRLASSIQAGYKKAFTAIVDSNITTIIAAVILLNFDSGPIKGFALTLIIGIVSSMFTALFMTRTFFAFWIHRTTQKELSMMQLFKKSSFDFLKRAKMSFTIVVFILLIGLFFFAKERGSIFGMDFTGGYALVVDLKESEGTNYRAKTEQALLAAGAKPSDITIRELNRPSRLRIQLSKHLEESGNPFYAMEPRIDNETALFTFQENPRIVWIVDALTAGGLQINDASLPDLSLYWTQVSGQLSDSMRNQALFGLVLALVAILIYLTIRFEFAYAISATIALGHDLLVTLAFICILHYFMPTVQIDLAAIAALMTIIGYSLNDTIIIFDRIREDLHLHRKKKPFAEIVNDALNSTLSRTIMTSTTTFCAIFALVLFGGASIFNFSLIMSLGVLLGTFSSLFIAAPLLLFFQKRQLQSKEKVREVNSPSH